MYLEGDVTTDSKHYWMVCNPTDVLHELSCKITEVNHFNLNYFMMFTKFIVATRSSGT